jgi:hypothetical protein
MMFLSGVFFPRVGIIGAGTMGNAWHCAGLRGWAGIKGGDGRHL